MGRIYKISSGTNFDKKKKSWKCEAVCSVEKKNVDHSATPRDTKIRDSILIPTPFTPLQWIKRKRSEDEGQKLIPEKEIYLAE